MANIIFITTKFLYPPDEGGKIDSFMNLKVLSANNNVFLYYIGKKNQNEEKLKKETKLAGCLNFDKDTKNSIFGLLKNIFSYTPYTFSKYHDRKIYKVIEKLIKEKKIEVVFLDHLHMAYYGKSLKEKYCNLKIILREHNVEYIFWQRIFKEERNVFKKIIFCWQWLKIKRYERKIMKYFDKYLMISAVDEGKLKEIAPDVNCTIFPTPVDVEGYQLFSKESKPVPYSLIYLGNFSWLPNLNGVLWFLKEVWPKIIKTFPQVQFFIVGKNPPEELKKYSSKNIIITGYVDDIKPWVDKAEVFIVPLFSGGGIRIKILEALAMGKVIITTSIGSEGIEVENGKHVIIADDKDSFAQGIEKLFRHKEIQASLSKNSLELMREKYSLEAAQGLLDKTIMEILGEVIHFQ